MWSIVTDPRLRHDNASQRGHSMDLQIVTIACIVPNWEPDTSTGLEVPNLTLIAVTLGKPDMDCYAMPPRKVWPSGAGATQLGFFVLAHY